MGDDERQRIFQQWVHEHGAILHRTVRGFAPGSDADDLMQELLMALWRAIPAFRGASSPATFIYRVSHNAALTWKKLDAREAAEPLPSPDGVADCEDRSEEHDDERLLALLYDEIHKLRPTDRSLMLLSLDGLSYDEIGSIHGLSSNAIGVRLHRLRKQVFDSVKEKLDEV